MYYLYYINLRNLLSVINANSLCSSKLCRVRLMIFANIWKTKGGEQSPLKAPLSILMKPSEISTLCWPIVSQGADCTTNSVVSLPNFYLTKLFIVRHFLFVLRLDCGPIKTYFCCRIDCKVLVWLEYW